MNRTFRPKKIISGGQTGADRGALDAAMILGIEHGGYCPKGRKAQDGKVPAQYKLKEVSGGYSQRTRANVLRSDATLIITIGPLAESRGCTLTLEFARKFKRPVFHIPLGDLEPEDYYVRRFLNKHRPEVLNVAGNREETRPTIHQQVRDLLVKTLGTRGLPQVDYDSSARRFTRCQSNNDGDCQFVVCPQLRDGEPGKSGRHCPWDMINYDD